MEKGNYAIIHDIYYLTNGMIMISLESNCNISFHDRIVSIYNRNIEWRITGVEPKNTIQQFEFKKILTDPTNMFGRFRIKSCGIDSKIEKGKKYIVKKSSTHLGSV